MSIFNLTKYPIVVLSLCLMITACTPRTFYQAGTFDETFYNNNAPAENDNIAFDPFLPSLPSSGKVEGRWQPINEATRNIYYNEFKEGKFAAYTADGRNTLALGSYIGTPNGAIIHYFSEVQKREVSSVCVFETLDLLSCTVENEQTVRLRRY